MTPTPLTSSNAPRALPGLLAVAVAAVVLGILGMHALSAHGAMSTDHAAMSMGTMGTMGAVDHVHAVDTIDAVVVPEVASLGEGHDMADMGGMAMLCGAMLVAAVGVLVALLRVRRIPRTWFRLAGVPASVTGWATARWASGPPPVWEFSVIRC